jgi:hypothetical protein
MLCLRRPVLALAFSALVGCNRPAPLSDGAPSADALARAVLEAATTNDRPALDRLALSEREFREHVWPELPAARPERNLPFSYVWGDLHQKSRLSLSRTLPQMTDRQYALKGVTFGEVTKYPSYVVHRGSVFQVTDSTGAATTIRVAGSFLAKDGVWKVFSYVVDD